MNHEHIKKHIAKYDYIEGPEATENFNRVATAVFQSKKTTVPGVMAPKKKKAVKRKSGRAHSHCSMNSPGCVPASLNWKAKPH